jgi:hypothetical protein
MSVSVHGTNGITFNDGSTQNTRPAVGFHNRIINGDMRIDQRNAGAVVSNGTTDAYCLDRFAFAGTSASKFTARRSTTAPSGFTNSLLITSSSAYTVGASDFFYVMQGIEGFNVSDLAFGSASAQSITISFWVRSSLTGTFGGAVRNKIAGADRSYPFSYSISASNTWEKKTITVAGDTSGTWTTDNSCSITVCIGLGVGTTFSGTAGAWAGSNLVSSSGATSVVSTNGATFYITGVQLEAGSTATEFERRPIGTELAMCQRYFSKSYDDETAPGSATTLGLVFGGKLSASSYGYCSVNYDVKMRGVPTINFWDGNGNASKFSYLTEPGATTTFTHNIAPGSSPFNMSSRSFCIVASAAIVNSSFLHFQASAEL